nr:hypothetical protein [Tanacetum cinerariifolium]
MFATVTVFMVDGSLKHVLLGKDRNADDPHTFTDLYMSSSDPVFAEDYGTMGLRYGTPNFSSGATFVLYTCVPFSYYLRERKRQDVECEKSDREVQPVFRNLLILDVKEANVISDMVFTGSVWVG